MDKVRVSIFPYFKHFSGQFKDKKFDSVRPRGKRSKTTRHVDLQFHPEDLDGPPKNWGDILVR